MPLSYLPCSSSPLRQGEIISNLFELRPKISPGEDIDVGQTPLVERIDHPLAVVVTQDCDLDWDFKARRNQAESDKLLAHVLFCDLFTTKEIRNRSRLNSELFRHVKLNQNERYHHLSEARIGETEWVLLGLHLASELASDIQALIGESELALPELYADFKSMFSLPIEYVYSLTSAGNAVRKAILPAPYLHDFVHRLHAFLGRIAVPE